MAKMSKQTQSMIDRLTELDGYANEDVRLTMIDSIVTSLKKGIYPTKVLSLLSFYSISFAKEKNKGLKRVLLVSSSLAKWGYPSPLQFL